MRAGFFATGRSGLPLTAQQQLSHLGREFQRPARASHFMVLDKSVTKHISRDLSQYPPGLLVRRDVILATTTTRAEELRCL